MAVKGTTQERCSLITRCKQVNYKGMKPDTYNKFFVFLNEKYKASFNLSLQMMVEHNPLESIYYLHKFQSNASNVGHLQ